MNTLEFKEEHISQFLSNAKNINFVSDWQEENVIEVIEIEDGVETNTEIITTFWF